MPFAGDNTEISATKWGVTQSIAHGIYGRINVAERVEKVPQFLWDTLCARRERFEQNKDIVWRPRNDKAKQNGG